MNVSFGCQMFLESHCFNYYYMVSILGINHTLFPPAVLGLVRETVGKMGWCLWLSPEWSPPSGLLSHTPVLWHESWPGSQSPGSGLVCSLATVLHLHFQPPSASFSEKNQWAWMYSSPWSLWSLWLHPGVSALPSTLLLTGVTQVPESFHICW